MVAACALLPLAVRSLRNTSPFMLFAIPAASHALGSDFRFSALFARFRRPEASRARPTPIARASTSRCWSPCAWSRSCSAGSAYASGMDSLNWRPINERALAAARACDGPLYNHYDDGGTLIWFLPEKPVFIDGRQDPYRSTS